jgi:hypothetical protein
VRSLIIFLCTSQLLTFDVIQLLDLSKTNKNDKKLKTNMVLDNNSPPLKNDR